MKNKIELKELFKIKSRMIEEEYQETEKIENFIFDKLKLLNEEVFGEDEVSKNWEVEVMEDEFFIYYKFGNISFKEILKLSEVYKKYGFSLYYITDCFTRKDKERGLIFGFHKIEDEK